MPRRTATESVSRLQRAARRTNFAVAAIALVGLIGWLTDKHLLLTFGTDFPAVKPATLACFLLTAAALHVMATRRDQAGYAAPWIAAIVVALLAGLELMNGISTGMATATAGTFLLMAAALAVLPLDGPGSRTAVRVLAMAIAALALVALAGLTFRLLRLYMAAPSIGLSLPEALAFLLTSFTLAAVRPDPYLVRFVERDTPGAVMTRRLLPAAFALPLLIGWAQTLGQRVGWFDTGAGEGGLAVAMMIAYAALILWVAGLLDEMNARRTQAQHQADTEREWRQATLSHIGDAVVATDADAVVRFLNPAAAALTGWPAEAAIGRPAAQLFRLIDERTGAEIADPLTEALRDRRAVRADGDFALRSRDGHSHPIDASAVPIENPAGQLAGAVLVLRDAAARREHDRAMRDAYADLDRRVIERTAELERTTAALRESTALLRTFAASTPDLISAKDRDGRLLMLNPAAVRALGRPEEDAIGRTIAELAHDAHEAQNVMDTDQRVIAGGESLVVEEIYSSGGETRTYLVTKSPLRDAANDVIGLVSVATDITERKKAQRELEELLAAEQRLRSEAEQANRAKDEFLAIVSHELRSPLNALKGWSHVLSASRSPDPGLIVRATQAIKRNVEHQARLIDDLLDTSRIISGKLILERRPVNLVETVHAALDLARAAAAAKSIELRFASDHPAIAAEGDQGRLQQVVTNLLSNAMKFTPENGLIEITLRRLGARIELAVRDTGIGIAADFLPHVFDRFSQADTSTTRRHGGLGIGLALVRHLVELHGGQVRAFSPGVGRGATFTVDLPASKALSFVPARESGEEVHRPGGVLAGLRVYAVDDDPDARDVLELALTQAGAAVHVFASSRQLANALETAAAAELPAVLLFDLAMPDEDGFAALARARALDAARAIPAIAVTAFTQVDRTRIAAAGFYDVVGKPIDTEKLTQLILAAATRSERVQPISRAGRRSEPQAR